MKNGILNTISVNQNVYYYIYEILIDHQLINYTL